MRRILSQKRGPDAPPQALLDMRQFAGPML